MDFLTTIFLSNSAKKPLKKRFLRKNHPLSKDNAQVQKKTFAYPKNIYLELRESSKSTSKNCF